MNNNILLSVENVVKKYGDYTALNNASISVPESSIYGLLGPNGAGKTTLMRIINQITAPDSGIVLFEGKKLNKEHIKKIGYLPEERGLYKKMKVGEQALYLAQLKGMSYSEAVKKLRIWFEKLNITSWWNKKVEELSKGMAQKIQFVVTVIHQPRLLIFDEPFSALDPLIRREMQDELLKIQEKLKKTMVFITHDFLEAIKMGDHIAIMKDGEVSQVGTPEEIVANPKDQYVKDFCEDVPKYKVLSASKVMREECCDDTKKMFENGSNNIPHNSKIETLIDKLVDTDQKFPVVNSETGELIGEIDRAIVMKSMKSAS